MWSCVIMLVFFVFFKQKTAYEMRISDWSSDVCSSDLGVAVTRSQPVFRSVVIVCAAALALAACSDDGTEDTTETTPRAGSESTDIVLESIADDVIVPAYEELVGALSDLHEAVESLCEAPAPAALDQARTDWRAVDLAWARTQALRSEEHTSELQSLMRTSYAVFCL